jgi:hypothetical protein
MLLEAFTSRLIGLSPYFAWAAFSLWLHPRIHNLGRLLRSDALARLSSVPVRVRPLLLQNLRLFPSVLVPIARLLRI